MTGAETPWFLSDDDLIGFLASLDDVFNAAVGDHPALADVRAKVAAQVDVVLAEIARRGIEIPRRRRRMTAYEDAAREAKAARLGQAFRGYAAMVCENAGTPFDAAALYVMARSTRPGTWDDLADAIGVNHPSQRTVDLIVSGFKIAAENAADDPFDGLPR